MENTTFWLELLKQPILFVITMVAMLVFIGMTYDFILKMLNKQLPHEDSPTDDVDDEDDDGEVNEPPEPTNVPKPPTPPNDTLKGEEEIPDGAEEIENNDGTTTLVYTYDWEGEQPSWTDAHWYAGDCLSPNWSAEGDKTKANSTEKERVN